MKLNNNQLMDYNIHKQEETLASYLIGYLAFPIVFGTACAIIIESLV